MILKISGFGNWFFTPGPVIMFFVLVLFLNPLVGLIRRRWMLSPAELAQIYVMWIVGSGVTTDGFVSYFLPKVTSVIYYASPENNWRESLLPYIPEWIIPHREFAQIRNFYEGAPKGQGVPWRTLAFSLTPLAAFFPVAFHIHDLHHGHSAETVDYQRTPRLSHDPVAHCHDPGWRPSFLNQSFFQGLADVVGLCHPLCHQFPQPIDALLSLSCPHINTSGEYIYLFRDLVGVRIGVSFMMLGFTYFIRPGGLPRVVAFFLILATTSYRRSRLPFWEVDITILCSVTG